MLERFANCGHRHVIGQVVAFDGNDPLRLIDLLGCRRGRNLHRVERQNATSVGLFNAAGMDFHYPRRLNNDELELAGRRGSKVTLLGMKRKLRHGVASLLPVRQEGFTDMPEGDLLEVLEAIDGGIVPRPLAAPRAEQARQRLTH